MTLLDAAVLATFGARDRRLLRVILQVLSAQSQGNLSSGARSANENELLPPRDDGETLIEWACRCRMPLVTADARKADVAATLREAQENLCHAEKFGIVPLPLGGDRYPPLLSAIPDPPPVLWTRGDAAHLVKPSIAIVGSRAATPHGVEMARRLASDLASAGLVIVSGLARGIDSVAHSAALAAGGTTIAVLGCGADRVYPPEHAELARNIRSAGAIASEFPPACPPLPHHFPLRNRIISGLAHAVVVVEAPEKSGALITASAAAEQGRDVLVVPGPVADGRNRGGHLLIRDGAKLVETADDVLQEIGRPVSLCAAEAQAFDPLLLPDALDFTVDELAERSGERPSVVLARLLELELSGRIQRIGGGRFVRSSRGVLP